MKTKSFKFSLGMKIASILSCLAIVSMGFASWWIVNIPEETTYGDFTVYSTDVKRIVFDVDGDSSTPNIVFGKDSAGDNLQNKWLLAGTDVTAQDLEAEIVFDVYVGDESEDGTTVSQSTTKLNDLLTTIDITFAANDSIKAALASAISDNYITAPTVSATYKLYNEAGTATTGNAISTGITANAYDATDNEATVTITAPAASKIQVTLKITFDWGSAFNATIGETTDNYNPYVYFNNLENNTTNVTAAKNALAAIFALKADTAETTATEYAITLDATTK